MGFHLSNITLIIFLSIALLTSSAQEIKSARLLDLIIRDYTFKSFNNKQHHFRTGKPHRIILPSNLSGINVNTIRFRCGSLRRYGAKINEFHLATGINVHPCTKRLVLVRQYLGSNWSSMYYDNYELSGYQLISPVLGLLAYNAAASNTNLSNTINPSELGIQAGKKPIIIDFSNTSLINPSSSGIIPLCASFDPDGKVTLTNQVMPYVCVATRHGHFGLVVESPLMPLKRKIASKWKIAIGSSIGAALGAFLLTLLVIAMFVNAKKKATMDDMERRAYEEEALQVSMVGHVRALTASGTRTVPTIEHQEYRPPPH